MELGMRYYKSTSIELGDDGIVYCRAIANDNYDETDLASLRDKMEEISNGERFRILMEMKEFEILLTKKARTFMGNDPKSAKLVIAEAVVIQSTTTRILFNLLLRVNNPKFPFQAFNNEDKAVAWLQAQN